MKDYIPYLRSLVGHAPIQAIGVTALIVDEEGSLLWEKRSDNGLYCLPGGSLNYEEKVFDGLRREIEEETGVQIKEATLFAITSGADTTLRYPNGDITNYVTLVFYCPLKKKAIPLKAEDGESSELFFAPPSKFPPKEQWLKGTEELIEKYQRHDFGVSID
jgi:8-oxo-dGTP pyrophosphatase MutT (NUDIX family)